MGKNEIDVVNSARIFIKKEEKWWGEYHKKQSAKPVISRSLVQTGQKEGLWRMRGQTVPTTSMRYISQLLNKRRFINIPDNTTQPYPTFARDECLLFSCVIIAECLGIMRIFPSCNLKLWKLSFLEIKQPGCYLSYIDFKSSFELIHLTPLINIKAVPLDPCSESKGQIHPDMLCMCMIRIHRAHVCMYPCSNPARFLHLYENAWESMPWGWTQSHRRLPWG